MLCEAVTGPPAAEDTEAGLRALGAAPKPHRALKFRVPQHPVACEAGLWSGTLLGGLPARPRAGAPIMSRT